MDEPKHHPTSPTLPTATRSTASTHPTDTEQRSTNVQTNVRNQMAHLGHPSAAEHQTPTDRVLADASVGMSDRTHPGGHPHSPEVMVERMNRAHATELMFRIRRLNSSFSRVERPTPPIRAAVNSFIYLEAGEALIAIGEQTFLFQEGEGAIVPAGEHFSIRYYNRCTGYMGGFDTRLIGGEHTATNAIKEFVVLRKWGGNKVSFSALHRRYVASLLDRLMIENEGANDPTIIRTYLLAFLAEADAACHSAAPDTEAESRSSLCNRFIDLVFDHFAENLPIGRYAEMLSISSTYLHRVIKRHTGRTPLAWIEEAVISEAKVQLIHTDASVGDVASKVGILDPSYFTRLFKRHVGMTPSEFRTSAEKS